MRKTLDYLKLDNAGIIFPSTSGERNTGVFRFCCDLREEVEPAVLQQALEEPLGFFSHFRCVLRSGVFWYYLESSDAPARVHETGPRVCAPLFHRGKRNLLFDVSYYRCRITLEVYHVISDGTGALEFLRFLVCRYLALRHPDAFPAPPEPDYSPPESRRYEDSFRKYYHKAKGEESPQPRRPLRLNGSWSPDYRVIEGRLPLAPVLAAAKARSTTLTVLLSALIAGAIHEEQSMDRAEKPMVLTIPVNLRRHFPSETARNFFGNIRVSYTFPPEGADLDAVCAALDREFRRELTRDRLALTISKWMSIEKNPVVRALPLPVKNFGLRCARWASDRGETIVVSNVGQISMPAEACAYVRSFSVCASTGRTQACVCSFGDELTVSFSSRFWETDIQRNFFRALSALGIPAEIDGNFL